jgi:hypothetical protein
MGSQAAKSVTEMLVQVDERQIYVPSVANTHMISNKAVIRDLLPLKDSKNTNIVLGKPLEENH